jgi:hypothetical protein
VKINPSKSRLILFLAMRKIQFLLLFLAALFVQSVYAQRYISPQGDTVDPRFQLSLGGYFPEMTTSMRIDTKIGIGTELSLEDLFNLEKEMSVFRIAGNFDISRRSTLQGSYVGINRDNTVTLERDITIGDTTYNAGAQMEINFDVNYYALTYQYNLFEKVNWKAGFSAGLRFAEFKTAFRAQFNNQSASTTTQVGAPALLIGVHGSAYLAPRLLGTYSMEYFQLTVSDIKIKVLETNVALQYFITKNIGLGGGYASSSYQVNDIPISDNLDGRVDFIFEGFHLFGSVKF